MSLETFELVLKKWGKLVKKDENNYWICIGGGEPTLHPKFWEIIDISLKYGFPCVPINGKNKKDALKLIELSDKNLLRVVLSLDEWHEPIDVEVVEAFQKGLVKYQRNWGIEYEYEDKKVGSKGIVTIEKAVNAGRCKEGVEGCCCQMSLAKPDGSIFGCGCTDAPFIGTVKEGIFSNYKKFPLTGGCSKVLLNCL